MGQQDSEVVFFFEQDPVYLADLSGDEREAGFGSFFHIYVQGQRQRVLAASRTSRDALVSAIDELKQANRRWQDLVSQGAVGIVHGSSFFRAAAAAVKPLRNGQMGHES